MKADLPVQQLLHATRRGTVRGPRRVKRLEARTPKRVPGPHLAGLGGIKKELLLTKRETLKGSKVQTVW